jgi:hypothetical protein
MTGSIRCAALARRLLSTARMHHVVPSLLAVVLVACGSDPAPAPARAAILDGVVDVDADAVVLTGHMIGAGEMCSGMLIMPDVVLTARHCLTTDRSFGPIVCDGESPTIRHMVVAVSDAIVATGDSLDDPAFALVEVAEVIGLPGADTIAACGNDLIAVRLPAPLPGITPVALRLSSPPAVGETLSIVGFGGNPPSDVASTGIRRRRDGVTITSVGHLADASGVTVTTDTEFVIDEGACPGDSGGPAFDADGAVVGVMSRGDRVTCRSMIYGSVEPHAAFLRDLAAASSARLGIDVPAWAVAPADPPDAGVDAGPAEADAGVVDPPGRHGGGGCAAGPGGAAPALVLLLVIAATRRPSRPCRRRARASSRGSRR